MRLQELVNKELGSNAKLEKKQDLEVYSVKIGVKSSDNWITGGTDSFYPVYAKFKKGDKFFEHITYVKPDQNFWDKYSSFEEKLFIAR